jgi:hypothetical protein
LTHVLMTTLLAIVPSIPHFKRCFLVNSRAYLHSLGVL